MKGSGKWKDKEIEQIMGLETSGVEHAVLSMALAPDEQWIAAVTVSGPVHFFGDNHKAIFNPVGLGDDTVGTTCLRFSPIMDEGRYTMLATLSSGRVSQFKVKVNAEYVTMNSFVEADNEVMVGEYATDGLSFATGGSDKVVRLYDSRTMQMSLAFTEGIDHHGQSTLAHHNRIFAIKFLSPNTFISAGWESSMLLFDSRASTNAQRSFAGPRVSGDSLSLLGSFTVGAASDRTENQLQLFDLRSKGDEAFQSVTVGSRLFALRLQNNKDTNHVEAWACGNNDNAVVVVDMTTGLEIAAVRGVPGSLFALEHSAQQDCLLFGGSRNSVFKISL